MVECPVRHPLPSPFFFPPSANAMWSESKAVRCAGRAVPSCWRPKGAKVTGSVVPAQLRRFRRIKNSLLVTFGISVWSTVINSSTGIKTQKQYTAANPWRGDRKLHSVDTMWAVQLSRPPVSWVCSEASWGQCRVQSALALCTTSNISVFHSEETVQTA